MSNTQHPPTNPSISNLLTLPASTQSVDTPALTNISSVPTTASAIATTVPASADLASLFAPSSWQTQSSYGTASLTPRQSWDSPASTFCSSMNPLSRNPATSPPDSDTISPSYDMNQLSPLQQFPGPSISNILSAGPRHQHPSAMLTAQNAPSNPALAPLCFPSNNLYLAKPSSAPAYGGLRQLSSPTEGHPRYGGQLGMRIPLPRRVTSNPHPSHCYQPRQLWPSYSVSAMNGSITASTNNPGSHLPLLGSTQPEILPGLKSGHRANPQQVYGGHIPELANNRPFKCNGCPQSFNRNHDLKRHKRIHLAVKPFPCRHCDKSFSRKDALKRHILVKGCGKEEVSEANSAKQERSTVKEDNDLESNGHA